MHVVLPLHKLHPLDSLLVKQSRVTKVVRLHDRGIQRRKVECGDRYIIEALCWFDDGRTLVLLVRTFALQSRYDVARFSCTSEQLGYDLYLLPTG